MAQAHVTGKPPMKTYKTYLTLYQDTWDKLRREAAAKHINGRQAIQALLTQWALAQEPIEPQPRKIDAAFSVEGTEWTDEGPEDT
jgi:hypothetical protein